MIRVLKEQSLLVGVVLAEETVDGDLAGTGGRYDEQNESRGWYRKDSLTRLGRFHSWLRCWAVLHVEDLAAFLRVLGTCLQGKYSISLKEKEREGEREREIEREREKEREKERERESKRMK